MPVSFACAYCHAELVDSSAIARYNALPSEHWAELLDAWMCHPDQSLSQDLISKGKGIKPRNDEGLVGTSYILFPRVATKNWTTPSESQVSPLLLSFRFSPTSLPPLSRRIYKKVELPFQLVITGRLPEGTVLSWKQPRDARLIQESKIELSQEKLLLNNLLAKAFALKATLENTFNQEATGACTDTLLSLLQPIRSPSDDLLFPALCTCCSALVGYHVKPLAPSSSSSDPTSFRLLKYAAYPLVGATSTARESFPEYSLSCHVTAEMLETGQAHACHRFVVEDDEEEKPRLLVSLDIFSNICFSFADSRPLAALVLQSRYSHLVLYILASRQHSSVFSSKLLCLANFRS